MAFLILVSTKELISFYYYETPIHYGTLIPYLTSNCISLFNHSKIMINNQVSNSK